METYKLKLITNYTNDKEMEKVLVSKTIDIRFIPYKGLLIVDKAMGISQAIDTIAYDHEHDEFVTMVTTYVDNVWQTIKDNIDMYRQTSAVIRCKRSGTNEETKRLNVSLITDSALRDLVRCEEFMNHDNEVRNTTVLRNFCGAIMGADRWAVRFDESNPLQYMYDVMDIVKDKMSVVAEEKTE